MSIRPSSRSSSAVGYTTPIDRKASPAMQSTTAIATKAVANLQMPLVESLHVSRSEPVLEVRASAGICRVPGATCTPSAQSPSRVPSRRGGSSAPSQPKRSPGAPGSLRVARKDISLPGRESCASQPAPPRSLSSHNGACPPDDSMPADSHYSRSLPSSRRAMTREAAQTAPATGWRKVSASTSIQPHLSASCKHQG